MLMLAYFLLFLIVFVFGSSIGSFMNVVIYRLPHGESPAAGHSHCTSCGTTLSPLDLVPLLSWVLLRGRCRYCHAPISARYPLVELAGGVLAVVAAMRFGLTAQMLLAFAVSQVLLATAIIDLDTMTIPDSLSISLGVLALLSIPLVPMPLWHRLAGAVAISLPLWLITLAVRDAFGGGDIKLMMSAGLYLGLGGVLVGFFVTLLLGGSYGCWLLVFRNGKGKHFAFGPFIAVGVLFSVFWGQAVADWYVGLLT